jgi:hypothetical protein
MLLEAHCEAVDLADKPVTTGKLADIVAGGERVQSLIEQSLRQLVGPTPHDAPPPTLTHRARQTGERCRSLVRELRQLADDPTVMSATADAPLTAAMRSCVACAESAVRLMNSMPADAATQTRLCDGVDGLLDALSDKLNGLRTARNRQARQDERIAALSYWLEAVHAGRRMALAPVTALAEAVVRDARQGEPLISPAPAPVSPAATAPALLAWRNRLIATQALTAAHVAAIAFEPSPDRDVLVTALLVADLGMLSVPPEILAQPGALTPAQWRTVEQHPRSGAEALACLTAAEPRILAVVRDHHERPDGTGYPQGAKSIDPLALKAAACGTYAALLAARPHRDARDPQAALTETLLAAERGQIDRSAALWLRQLSFFPIGSVVELDDGTVGVVVATRDDSRPMIALLTDADGHRLPGPQVTDLSAAPDRAIRRALSSQDRRLRLGALYPQFA